MFVNATARKVPAMTTANQIVNEIVTLHKDFAECQVEELLASKAMISDFSFIHGELVDHVSSNETNAATIAVKWLEDNK